MIAKVKSLLGNKCANVFTNGKFTKVVPMTSRKEAAESLIDFTDAVGIPEMLMMDGATEFNILTLLNRHDKCVSSFTWQNREGRIRIMQPNERLVSWLSVGNCECKRKGTISVVGLWSCI
jgi:hypothetical protein